MKSQTLFMIVGITISLLVFSQCKPTKKLLYQEAGNHLITDNYLIKDVKKIDDQDLSLVSKALGTSTFTTCAEISTPNTCVKLNKTISTSLAQNELGDLIEKYNPAKTEEGNYIVSNSAFVTSFAKLGNKQSSVLSDLNNYGLRENTICGEYMGVHKFTRFLRVNRQGYINRDFDNKINSIVNQYQ